MARATRKRHKKPPGRKPMGDHARDQRIPVCVTPAEVDELLALARASQQTVSDYLVYAALGPRH